MRICIGVMSDTVESIETVRVAVYAAPCARSIPPVGGEVSRVTCCWSDIVRPVPLRYSTQTVLTPSPAGRFVDTLAEYGNQPPWMPVPRSTLMSTARATVDSIETGVLDV